MGKILNLRTVNDDKVHVTLELSQKEVLWLEGNMEKMHVFSENNLTHETKLVQRGKKESTRYFLIPKNLRRKVMISNSVKCTTIEGKTKQLYIFAVNKY